MDFRKLLEGNCGEANPIAQLATHANHGQPSTTNQMVPENMNVPNTFNMNELMNQLQNFECARSTRMPPLTGPRPSSSVMYNHIEEQQENLVFDNFFSLEEQTNNYQQNFRPQSDQLEAEEWERLQKEIAEAQEIFHTLEDYEEIKEEHTEVSKSESKNLNDVVKDPSYLVYDNLSVEDVYGITDLGINFNDNEHFFNFVENYVLKNSSKKYQKYCPGTTRKGTYVVSENKYKIANNNDLQDLGDDLVMNEQYSEAIAVARFISHNIKSDNDDNVFFMTDAYLHEHCFYQACQTLLTWLKNEPEYRDIVPPNFVMEEKAETTVDKGQLRALMKIFIKAVQRNPNLPDVRLQIALAKLCEIDQDHEKSIDCYKFILSNKIDEKLSDYVWMSLSTSLALVNKPEEAIKAYTNVGCRDNRNIIKINTKIGLIHLRNRNYRLATVFLYAALQNQDKMGYKDSDPSLENTWSRLRLCFELMRREDLCKAVDDRDYEKVWSYYNFCVIYDIDLVPNKT